MEPSLWGLSTFFCCNASGFQKNLYVVDICLFLERLQLQQKSLKDDTSLVSEHNIIAYRCLTFHCANNNDTFQKDSRVFISRMKFQRMHSTLPFFSNETNSSLIPFVSKFVVSRKKKTERKCLKACSFVHHTKRIP